MEATHGSSCLGAVFLVISQATLKKEKQGLPWWRSG